LNNNNILKVIYRMKTKKQGKTRSKSGRTVRSKKVYTKKVSNRSKNRRVTKKNRSNKKKGFSGGGEKLDKFKNAFRFGGGSKVEPAVEAAAAPAYSVASIDPITKNLVTDVKVGPNNKITARCECTRIPNTGESISSVGPSQVVPPLLAPPNLLETLNNPPVPSSSTGPEVAPVASVAPVSAVASAVEPSQVNPTLPPPNLLETLNNPLAQSSQSGPEVESAAATGPEGPVSESDVGFVEESPEGMNITQSPPPPVVPRLNMTASTTSRFNKRPSMIDRPLPLPPVKSYVPSQFSSEASLSPRGNIAEDEHVRRIRSSSPSPSFEPPISRSLTSSPIPPPITEQGQYTRKAASRDSYNRPPNQPLAFAEPEIPTSRARVGPEGKPKSRVEAAKREMEEARFGQA
jgi:hypothetical protein